MTPTEQDKELFRLASLIGCEPQDEERHRQQLADYIIADRKRVALEARIDEDEFVLKQLKDIWSLTNYAKIKVFIESRITELKAQQEEK